MTVSEVAAYLRAHDKYLILTHRRPDGDTLGCAAALCAMLRQMGKTAGILYNRETTEHFEQYVEQYWVADDFDYETVVSVDLAALSLFPDNAEMFKTRVDLAIDHHPSYEGFGQESCVHPECAACGEIPLRARAGARPADACCCAAALCRRVDRYGLLCLLQRHGEHAPRGRGADGDGHRL